jgi:hypothetical protein
MGHSSDISIWLHFSESTYPVLQTSADEIKLNEFDAVPQGDAILETIVDGRSHRRAICVLPSSPRPKWIAIEDR